MGRKTKWWKSMGNWGRRWGGNRSEDEDDDGNYTDMFPSFSAFRSQLSGSHGNVAGGSHGNVAGGIQLVADDDGAGQDDQDDEICFGTLRGNIVGIQYYRGTVNKKEMVALEREPTNRYDINAIKVTNVLGVQVGHIKREIARPLAFIVDTGLARLEGIVPYGQGNAYSMPVDLLLWGKPEHQKATVNKLKSSGYYLTTVSQGPQSSGAGGQEQYGASSMSPRRTFLTPAEVKDELDQLFQTIKEGDKTSVTEPVEAIQTTMYPHQKQALNWMMQCENSSRLPPFWQEKKGKFFNTVLNFTTDKRPENVKGGILADDMGLGKTLEMISLIVTNFHDNKPLATPISGLVRQTKQESKVAQKAKELPTSDSIAPRKDMPILLKVRPNRSNIITPTKGDTMRESGGCSSKVTTPKKEDLPTLPSLPKLPRLACQANVISPKKENIDSSANVVTAEDDIGQQPASPEINHPADDSSRHMNMVSSSAFSSQSENLTTQDRVALEKDLDWMAKGMATMKQQLKREKSEMANFTEHCVTGRYRLLKLGKAYILFCGDKKMTVPPAIHNNDVLELHDTIVTTEKGEAYEIMEHNGQITFEEIVTAAISKTQGGDVIEDRDVTVINDDPDSYPEDYETINVPSPAVKNDPDFKPENYETGNIPSPTVMIDPDFKPGDYEMGNIPSPTVKIDPNFDPGECGKGTVPSRKAGAGGRSRRNAKRPARYVFSDDEVDLTEDEPAPKKVKTVSKSQNKGKALVKGTTTRKGKKTNILVESDLNISNSTSRKGEMEPLIQPVPNTLSEGLRPESLDLSSRHTLCGNDVKPHSNSNPYTLNISNAGDGKKKEPLDQARLNTVILCNAGDMKETEPLDQARLNTVILCNAGDMKETEPLDQPHLNTVISSTTADWTAQDDRDQEILPELDTPTNGGDNQFMTYDLPDIEPVDLDNNKDVGSQHQTVMPDYSKPGTNVVGPSTGRTPCTGPRCTLIVCPLSVISNWLDQFERHVHKGVHLNIYLYYGTGRTNNYALLEKQDVVITTYSTVAADYKKCGVDPRRRSLRHVKWLRIVLDEGHVIRNPSAQQTKAILELQAERRWVLTGTPLQNSMKDLWSLINFLRISPFTDRQWWRRSIERPLDRGDESALKRVQHLMGHVSLRRTKTQKVAGEPLVKLPARSVCIEHVTLSEEERSVYTAMQNEGKVIVSKYFRQGTLLHHYGDVLAILMRLRQLCCHPMLVAKAAQTMKETMAELEKTGGKVTEDLREKLIGTLVEVLSSGTDEECAICLDSLKTPVITHCAHVYCRPCIEAVVRNEQPQAKCPLCRGTLAMDKLLEVPQEEMQGHTTLKDKVTGDTWKSSAKTDALMNALLRLRTEDSRAKSIVVSQFTSLLSLVEIPLRVNGFRFVRLDGTMRPRARTQAIEDFSDLSSGSPTIILLSLKAGGVGINLTAASRVFLLDPAWNPASEEQCFDRCHRLGQTKDVIITKFVVEDSVEERMLELQEKKRKLMAGVFRQKQTDEEKRQNRIQDIKILLDL